MASESAEDGICSAWAARDTSGILSPYKFNRRPVQRDDVSLRILYCGVCHADVSSTRNEQNNSIYPLVPGHEIVGVVTELGSDVHGLQVGDHVGVGTYVNSCRDCESCISSRENYCPKLVPTYNMADSDGSITKGGYSTHIVVHQRYRFTIPNGYPLDKAALLLCAGLTVYSPMKRHDVNQPGKSLGVIGLDGLGHMAVKFGKAFGLQSLKSSLHFIIDTTAGNHPFDPYLSLLKVGGVMAIVCFPNEVKVHPASLNLGARSLCGSIVGGTKETREMLNFCAANKIYPAIEVIKMEYINEELQRLVNRGVKYRFVIDVENSFN